MSPTNKETVKKKKKKLQKSCTLPTIPHKVYDR